MMNRNRLYDILKKAGVIFTLTCLIFTAAGCSEPQKTSSEGSIDMSESIEIALSASGLTRDKVSNLHVEYDDDDGKNGGSVYNITFDSDGSKYEYIIQESDGSILTFDVSNDDTSDTEDNNSEKNDAANDSQGTNSSDGNSDKDNTAENIDGNTGSRTDAENTSADSNYIGVDKAKEIALEHAQVSESEVTFQKAKLSYDDGNHEYELEFYSDTMEYDYELDAHTGKIIDWDHDNFREDWD